MPYGRSKHVAANRLDLRRAAAPSVSAAAPSCAGRGEPTPTVPSFQEYVRSIERDDQSSDQRNDVRRVVVIHLRRDGEVVEELRQLAPVEPRAPRHPGDLAVDAIAAGAEDRAGLIRSREPLDRREGFFHAHPTVGLARPMAECQLGKSRCVTYRGTCSDCATAP